MDTITFTTYQLLVNEQVPTTELLKRLTTKETIKTTKAESHYEIKHKLTDQYYWLYASYGSALPLADKLLDTEKMHNINNPRTVHQAELRNQFFALYHLEQNLLYLSNSQKVSFLCEFIRDILSLGVIIKKMYKSPEEFLSILRLVDNVCLVSSHSLFTDKSGLFDEAGNILGLGNPDRIGIECKFKHVEKTLSFVKKFLEFFNKKENIEYDQLICVGRDDNNMEIVFNTDSFANKIEIKASKNVNGLFIDHGVEEALAKQLG